VVPHFFLQPDLDQAADGFGKRTVPVADVDSFATFTSGQRKPPSEGLASNGASSRGAHRDPALMRERRGGILPPVATNCLPGTGLRITLGAFCLWNTWNLEMFCSRFERNGPSVRGTLRPSCRCHVSGGPARFSEPANPANRPFSPSPLAEAPSRPLASSGR
jgi:hypothetical protein